MTLTPEIESLIAAGALFVLNHSGGKDSQAMMIKLLDLVPASQILVVHASLGEAEWEGALELARDQAADAGVPFLVARAAKSFLDMVDQRFAARPGVPSWPSAAQRQCTSDLKRDPIAREVRRYMKQRGLHLVVNCTGIRAQESASRAKVRTFQPSKRNSTAGRTWYEWAPIHDMTTLEVFATIAAAGQEPHPAYAAGNDRLSCVFCIFGSASDIARGAEARPELFAQYVAREQRTGYTMHMSRLSLVEIVAKAKAAAQVAA